MIGEACALGAALIWSFSVILFKRSEALSPQAINLGKNVSATLLLAVTWLVMGEPLDWGRPTGHWIALLASGILGISIADTLIFTALRRLGAGRFAIVDCAYAPVSVAAGVLFLGEPIGAMFLVGAVLVVAGVLVTSTDRASVPVSAHGAPSVWSGAVYGVSGIALMAYGVVLAKPALDQSSLVEVTTIRLAAGVVGQLIWIAIVPSQREALGVLLPSRAWRTLLPASFLGSYVAMLLWLGGFKWGQVTVSSVLNQLSSVFTLLLAWVLLGEALSRRRALGAGLAVGGAVVVALQ